MAGFKPGHFVFPAGSGKSFPCSQVCARAGAHPEACVPYPRVSDELSGFGRNLLLKRDSDWSARFAAALNPFASDELRDALAEDGHRLVRAGTRGSGRTWR